MRVIAGDARGHHLRGPKRAGVRPTTDRVRGALFSILEALGADLSRVVDLYAGTGSLGIEALSRGAGWCDFVERDPAACAVIRRNLAHTGLQARAAVHCMPVERALGSLQGTYTLALLDPPFDDPEVIPFLGRLAGSPLVGPGAIIALEHSRRQEVPASLPGFRLQERRYGDSSLALYIADVASGSGAARGAVPS